MSFWSDLFSKKKSVDPINQPNDHSSNSSKESTKVEDSDDWNYQELQFDEDNCLLYPDGLRLYHINFNSFDDIHIIEKKLGYFDGEVFTTFHDSNRNTTLSDNVIFWGIWELFTNKLLCIVSRDEVILEKCDIEQLKSNARKNWEPYNYDELENGVSLLVSLGEAVTNNSSIRQQFIERVFNKKSNDNVLDEGKFHFEFKDGLLCHCMYNGYDTFMFSTNTLFGIGLSEIDDYHEYANKTHRSENTMKRIINYQAYCLSHIDDDILDSEISKEKFAYDEDAFCINYIAMAAYYKQCDVEQELFILSTDGQYEILSKNTTNNITTTKIRAYREIFTFTNGHSDYNQLFSNKQDIQSDNSMNIAEDCQGYVYVMINPSLPDMVKIGMTTKDPNERAKELSTATGVPTPFILVFYKPFVDCYSTEQRIHQFLEEKGYRVSNNREFFNMPTKFAIDVVQAFYNLEQKELNQE